MPKRMEDYEAEEIEDYEEDGIEIQEKPSRGGKTKRGRSSSGEIGIQKRRGRGSKSKRRKLKSEEEGGGGRRKLKFVDDEAVEDDGEEEGEDEDDGEFDEFIVKEPEFDEEPDESDDDGDNDGSGRRPGFVLAEEDEEEDIEELERRVEDRFRQIHAEEYEDDTEVGQQALIPGVRDPKLWLVKCAISKEREVAACLMQKCIDNPGELLITSAVALDYLKGFVYVEAYKEAHVREACKGLRYVVLQKISLVPIKEMTDLICGESKTVVNYDWVRIKTGIYKGDLAKVVGHVPGRQQVRVKLIPRFHLQALAKGVESQKKGSGARPDRVPALLGNMELVRQLGVGVQSVRDWLAHGYTDRIDGLPGMIFKDGFHLKVVSGKSIKEVKPSLEELEEFQELDGDGDHTNPNKKKSFIKGDAVVVIEGDLRNLVGRVDKLELGIVHIKPEMEGLPETVAIKQTALQKCFKEGQHVKVVSGSQQGATGMVVKVDHQKQLITILSDATKEAICVFADHAVESGEVNNGDTMDDTHFGRYHKTPARFPKFSGGGRGYDGRDGFGKGVRVKLRLGPYKGCRGRVVEVKGSNIRVELESQMRTVVDRLHCISDSDDVAAAVTTPYRSGCETPMRDPRASPMPYLITPMRDAAASPMPYMMTTMRDPGAAPYMMTPRRDPRATPVPGDIRKT